MTLHIGKNFTLPLDLVTSTQAILARKRSGKSYTASVEAEELLAQKQQVVVIDPTSAWWGLRSSANGEGPGYPVVVFGGDHADAPLDFRAGKAMAAAVVEHGFSAIFDIGNLHTEEQVQFVMDFCSELLRINRQALHVFMDEADTFAPQNTRDKLQNKCLGTVSRLVKQGGIRGIGFTMITQRPASMNKDVLSQVDILTVLRMSHPLDIKAATDWIKSEVTVEFAKQVETALPSLPVGTAFFCSAPLNLGKRVEVRIRRTFNSGATPKPGERKVEPKVLAQVDIEKLGQKIAESVKRAQEDSPEYLKQRIAELEAQGGKADMGVLEDVQRMEQELAELRPLRERVEEAERIAQDRANRLQAFVSRMKNLLNEFEDADQAWKNWDPGDTTMTQLALATPASQRTPFPIPPSAVSKLADVTFAPNRDGRALGVNEPQQRILNAMATLWGMRNANVTIEWIACTAGTTPRARGFEENMRQLKVKGLVDGIRLTEQGKSIAQAASTPPTFRAVMERISAMVSTPQADMLRMLKNSRYSPAELAANLGTTERSRGFEENARQLRKRGFISLRGGQYHLVDWLQVLP